MGSKTCKVVCTCIKLHHHSGIVMRSATHLLMELCKNGTQCNARPYICTCVHSHNPGLLLHPEKNLKRVKKLKIMHKLAETKVHCTTARIANHASLQPD